jgi:hypothetical protein
MTPSSAMGDAYRRRGFGLIGLVGHEARPVVTESPIPTITGRERPVEYDGSSVHVVEYPDEQLSFLAHPRHYWSGNVRAKARAAVHDLELDGVEKFNRGRIQYEGRIEDAVELANDDAHNTRQVGGSYMMVDTPTLAPMDVVRSIQEGRVELRNPRLRADAAAAGRANQGLSRAAHLSGLTGPFD